jgi:hypothetical protein
MAHDVGLSTDPDQSNVIAGDMGADRSGLQATDIQTIWIEEQIWIKARRSFIADHGLPAPTVGASRHIGLALSGGGIRSATFSLGILQALSRRGRISQIDYLSTVSGGSYIGAFFGALYMSPKRRGSARSIDPEDRARFLVDPLGCDFGRSAVSALREFGRYLTPGGMSDMMFGASLIARNWLMVQLVLGLVALTLFLLLRGLPLPVVDDAWAPLAQRQMLRDSGSLYLLSAALLAWLCGLGIGIGYWFTRKEQSIASRARRALGAPLVIVTIVTVLGWAKLHSYAAWTPFLLIPTIAIGAYLFALARYGKAEDPSGGAGGRLALEFTVRQAEDHVRSKLTRALSSANLIAIILVAAGVINLLGHQMAQVLIHAATGWDQVVEDYGERSNLWSTLWVFIENFWPLMVVLLPCAITIWGHRALRHGTGPGWLARPSGQAMFGVSIMILWLAIWAMVASVLQFTQNVSLSPQLPDSIDKLLAICLSGLVLMVAAAALVLLGPGRLGGWLPRLGTVALVMAGVGLIGITFFSATVENIDNLSSLVTLYSVRLKRAYVGASNPGKDAGIDIDNAGDLLPMQAYYADRSEIAQYSALAEGDRRSGDVPMEMARPIHLINATIAQTVPDGKSNVVAYDRKGKPLHVSPVGVISGQGIDGAVDRVAHDDCESLALSDWTGISGAAASTAVGSMSSLGLSILAMMTNVRLGYWWKPEALTNWPLPLSWRDTMLGYLVSELLMQFDTSLADKRRWYLTDGGHFENSGAYPLLQRQLDFIIVCDNGADPDYRCDDMMRLMQRARIDLGADIAFLGKDRLDSILGVEGELRSAIGTYEELAVKPVEPASDVRPAGPYAALAKISYTRKMRHDAPSEGVMLLIKPRLNFSEPPELLAYKRREAGVHFPQQTTLDQFFDEEQWEAYRRFGEVVGARLFDSDIWIPSLLADASGEANP